MWTNEAPALVLASASPRRLQLLEQLQIPVRQLSLPAQADDEPRLANEMVVDYVTRTAQDKLQRALDHWRNTCPNERTPPMLAADTTVAIGQTILGKPRDAVDAKQILMQLAGNTHDVYTAVVLHHNGQPYETLTHATVEFTAQFAHCIDQYIETQEPFGKAGAYAIQGVAAAYINKVQGSYSGVVGLPLYETAELLRTAGLFK